MIRNVSIEIQSHLNTGMSQKHLDCFGWNIYLKTAGGKSVTQSVRMKMRHDDWFATFKMSGTFFFGIDGSYNFI